MSRTESSLLVTAEHWAWDLSIDLLLAYLDVIEVCIQQARFLEVTL